MEFSEAVFKRIKALLIENNMNVYALCMKGGIPYSTLNDFMNRKTKNLRMDTILHICEGFEISLANFFSDEIFKDVVAE